MPKKITNYYVVAVEPGSEKKVAAEIRKKKRINRADYPVVPVVPTDPRMVEAHEAERMVKDPETGAETWETYTTKPTTRQFVTFPGYVILKMVEDRLIFANVREVKGVWGFLPLPLPRQKEEDIKPPLALADEESALLMLRGQNATEVRLKENTKVRILTGMFANREGVVVGIPGRNQLHVEVEMMGQLVKVTLAMSDVQTIKKEDE